MRYKSQNFSFITTLDMKFIYLSTASGVDTEFERGGIDIELERRGVRGCNPPEKGASGVLGISPL